MSKQVVIIGAGGHAKVIADIIVKSGDRVYGFLDDNLEIGTTIANNEQFKIIGKIEKINKLKENTNLEFVIAIGDNTVRKNIAENYNVKYYTAIHPSSIIALDVSIEEGTVVMANTVINTSAKIGRHCIVNTGAIIEHDNIIENYVHVSPNATLSGTVKVGTMTHIGSGAAIKNNINICNNCIIGVGAVVVKDIKEPGVYVGVPARKTK